MNDDPDAIEAIKANLPDIEALKRRYREAMDSSAAARDEASLDRGYFDGTKSISSEWEDYTRKHSMFPININIVGPLIEGFVGFVQSQNTDPQAWPRSSMDQNAADIATKLLRYAADQAHYKDKKADCVENFYIEGVMAAVIEAGTRTNRHNKQKAHLAIHRIHPNEFFWDPHSREFDFSDARYMGIAKWLHISQIDDLYPEASQYGDIQPGDMLGGNNSKNRDVPTAWIDKKNRRVLVAEMYYIEKSAWKRIVFCHAGVLDFSDSAYQDDDGNSICPIVAMSAYINQDNDDDTMTYSRYGICRRMRAPQDEYNARKAASIRAAIDKRVQQTDLSAPDVSSETVRAEAAKPDGVIPFGWQVVQSADFSQHSALLAQSRAEIDRMAPTPALLGRSQSDSQSGRARMIAQQAGGTELHPCLSRIERWENEIYRRLWFAAIQFWSMEDDIRITGTDQTAQFLKINEPVMATKMLPVAGPNGQPAINPQTGHPILQPQQVQISTKNEVAKMDMDIIVVSVPEAASLEHETWGQLVELAKIAPPGSPQFLMALELYPLANKYEIIQKIKAQMAEVQQQQQAAQQQQIQDTIEAKNLANAQIQAKTAGIIASAKKHDAEAQRTTVETVKMAHQTSQEANRASILHNVDRAVVDGTRITDMHPGAVIPDGDQAVHPGSALPDAPQNTSNV